jgi:hypothetical protein
MDSCRISSLRSSHLSQCHQLNRRKQQSHLKRNQQRHRNKFRSKQRHKRSLHNLRR